MENNLTPFGEAIVLLRNLSDIQNGPPLEQHKAEWEEIMSKTNDFLNKWESSTITRKICCVVCENELTPKEKEGGNSCDECWLKNF